MTLAVPQIVDSAKSGTEQFVNLLISNSTVATLLIVIGGAVITACVVLLVWRKVAPQSRIGSYLQDGGNGTVVWCFLFILFGLCLILPAQIIPFVVQILATICQAVMNVFGSIFGL